MTTPLPLHKIEALKAVIAGEMLTSEQLKVLEACLADYRFVFRLGNGFKLNRDHLNELIQLVHDDVPFMVGERQKRAIRILNAAGAKGFQTESFYVRSRFDDKPGRDLTEDEIWEAVHG